MGDRSDLPRDLCFLGCAAAPGGPQPGPGPVLGLYESQPTPPKLHIELTHLSVGAPPLPDEEGGCRQKLPKKENLEYLLSQTPE